MTQGTFSQVLFEGQAIRCGRIENGFVELVFDLKGEPVN